MSDDPLAMFSAALSADEAMQSGLQTAIGEKKDAEALAAIAAFAAEQGFELTRENLTQLQHGMNTAVAEGELSDADLDGVAGGFIPHWWEDW